MLTSVAETASRLCAADQASIVRCEDEALQLVANCGFPPNMRTEFARWERFRSPLGSPTVSQRAVRDRRVVHIPDVSAIPNYPEEAIKLGRPRTSLGVPLMRKDKTIGLILLTRQQVEPFTDRQIELIETFVDQAVIAIENARLLS